MKDLQQHNHQAWQASPSGRRWQAEAERAGRPSGGSDTVQATPQAVAAVDGLRALRAERVVLEAEEERLKAIVLACMGEREALLIGTRLAATWKEVRPACRFDKEAFRAAHPKLYREYSVHGEPYRRFLLK